MSGENSKIKREKRTIEATMHLSCRGNHGKKYTLCSNCTELLDYALRSLERCRYQARKPTCGKCPVHCYRPVMKERVIEVRKVFNN